MLKNTGVGKLLLNGNEPVKISNSSEGFTVVQPSTSEIAPNGSLTFKVNFAPTEEKSYGGTVTVSSNDPSGDFSFTITASGVPTKPIASIFYGTMEIMQSGTIHAGEVMITQSGSIEVIIKNSGDAVLTIDPANITITGANAAAFSKQTNPGASISAGSQSQFTIQCTPTTPGENNATLTIPTNDASRNPAVVFLRVTVTRGAAVLELSQGGAVIANNTITPYDFGQVELGDNKTSVFTIKNTGNIPLELTNNPVVESSNPAFTISTQPANRTISPGDTVPFIIRYTPTAERQDTGTITIGNNSNSLMFTFTVTGTGYANKPQITLKQGNTAIAVNAEFDLGTIAAGKTKDIIFTIGNSGDADLAFVTVNNNRINLADNDAGLFAVTYQPSASMVVTPGNTTTFTVRFAPTTTGPNFTTTMQIKTNSRNNDEFAFVVKGAARPADTEARLSGLQFTQGKLDQQFHADITSYTLKIDAGLPLVQVTPTSMDSTINDLKVNGVSQSSGVQSRDIILASTATVTIVVTAEDGTTTQTYTVTINRIVNYSNANLTSLYASNMDETDVDNVLNFLDTNNKTYWDALPDETQLKFKVTPVNTNATVKINGATISNGVYTGGYNLNSGAAVTIFTFTILSEDGENQRTITFESRYMGSQWTKVGDLPGTGSNELSEYPYEHTVIVHNNQFMMTNSYETFLSPNGAAWTKSFTYPDDIDHWRCSTVLFNNTVYNIGGSKWNNSSEEYETASVVSSSTNGTIWTIASPVTGLTNGVQNHTSVVFNGAIYTMGGFTKTVEQTNAVWRSTNGTSWTSVAPPAWGAETATQAWYTITKYLLLAAAIMAVIQNTVMCGAPVMEPAGFRKPLLRHGPEGTTIRLL